MKKFLKKNQTKIMAILMTMAICLVMGGVSISASLAAGSGNYGLDNIGAVTGDGALIGSTSDDIRPLIGKIIVYLLSFLGIIFLILILYAGFLWMTSRGDEGQVEKAQELIKTAIIGVVIILCAYIITRFVFTDIKNAIETGA